MKIKKFESLSSVNSCLERSAFLHDTWNGERKEEKRSEESSRKDCVYKGYQRNRQRNDQGKIQGGQEADPAKNEEARGEEDEVGHFEEAA